MLAPATAFVLALALGAAPVQAPRARPVASEPGGGPSAKTPTAPSPTSPSAKTPTTQAPTSDAASPEVPDPESPTAPPSDEPPIGDQPPTDEAPSDAEPTDEIPPADAGTPSDDLAPDQAPTAEEEPAPEDDDPFGDHADEEPWPDDEGDAEDAEPLPDYDPLRDSPQAIRARHWVHTGIGTMAAGGALLVGAIIMGASDPCTRRAGNSCQVDARNRAALVMGIPAAILVGGGAAMLGIGLSRQRRIAVDLQAGRTTVGIVVRGRF